MKYINPEPSSIEISKSSYHWFAYLLQKQKMVHHAPRMCWKWQVVFLKCFKGRGSYEGRATGSRKKVAENLKVEEK